MIAFNIGKVKSEASLILVPQSSTFHSCAECYWDFFLNACNLRVSWDKSRFGLFSSLLSDNLVNLQISIFCLRSFVPIYLWFLVLFQYICFLLQGMLSCLFMLCPKAIIIFIIIFISLFFAFGQASLCSILTYIL